MPTLQRFTHCSIRMYAGDHNPPHFHVVTNDGSESLIEIGTLAVLRGGLAKRELAEALAWAGQNREYLHTKWRELNP